MWALRALHRLQIARAKFARAVNLSQLSIDPVDCLLFIAHGSNAVGDSTGNPATSQAPAAQPLPVAQVMLFIPSRINKNPLGEE